MKVFCPKCPNLYIPQLIQALSQDGQHQTTLDQVRVQAAAKRKRSRREPQLNLAALAIDWVFRCPNGHLLDGDLDEPFPVGILGATAASKSHYLPALIKELDDEGALLPREVSLSETPDTSPEVRQRITKIYKNRMILPPTDTGELEGPFGYSLRLGRRENERRFAAMLFDVAGEDLQHLSSMASVAPFIFHAKGLILLIDPTGLVETEFGPVDPDRRIRAKKLIGTIAIGLEQATQTRSFYLKRPLCVTVAKADSVHWECVDWEKELTATGLTKELRLTDESALLRRSSSSVRENFLALGAETLVQELEDRFDSDFLRYAAVSATGEMPTRDPSGTYGWDKPRPIGCSIPFLHVLRMADLRG